MGSDESRSTRPLGPHIVPVNYTIHDGAIVFRTTAYSVVGTYACGHDIAFEVGDIDVNDGTAVSVLAWSRGEVVDDAEERRDIQRHHDPQEEAAEVVEKWSEVEDVTCLVDDLSFHHTLNDVLEPEPSAPAEEEYPPS